MPGMLRSQAARPQGRLRLHEGGARLDPPGAPPAPGCAAPPSIVPAPPRPTPPPGTYVDDIPYSLNQRINAGLHTPIARLPDDAPTDPAVGLKEAEDVLDAAVWPTEASWSVPRAPASLRRLWARFQALRPTRLVLEATGEDEPAVVALRAATHHRRRQAPSARRPRHDDHKARLRTEPRLLTPTSITFRTHLTNELSKAPHTHRSTTRRRPNRPSGRAQCGDQRPARGGPHQAGAPHPARPAADRPPRTEPGSCRPPCPRIPQRSLSTSLLSLHGIDPTPAPSPLSDFDYLSYSLNQRTIGRLRTPISRRPDHAQRRHSNRPGGRARGGDKRPGRGSPHQAGASRPPRPATLAGPGPGPPTPAHRAASHRWGPAGGRDPAPAHPAPAPLGVPRVPTALTRPPGDAARRPPRAGPAAADRPVRRIPAGAPAAPGCRAPPATPTPRTTPPRPHEATAHLRRLPFVLT